MNLSDSQEAAAAPSQRLAHVARRPLALDGNYASLIEASEADNQQQTNEAFTEKWDRYADTGDLETFYAFQRRWYLDLYGFADEAALAAHLAACSTIVDAGCGLGYKAAWFARLARTRW
jgi:hypothetical protein